MQMAFPYPDADAMADGPAADESDEEGRWEMPDCVVCLDNPREVVVVACGHMTLCRACAAAMTSCPICRQDYFPSTGLLRVYLS